MRLPSSFLLVSGCFFLSGLAGLIYETAWTQQFAAVFGTAELALAAVLAAYMTGLALGAVLAGHLVDRIRRPVWLYALLELGIGASALAVPHAIRLAGVVQAMVLGQHELPSTDGSTAILVVYVTSSFAILLVPTAMMGATLPLLARHLVHREHQIASRVGALYAINTIGAAAGTLLAAFVLLPHLGLGATVWTGAGINAAVFLLAAGLDRSSASGRSLGGRETPFGEPDIGIANVPEGRWILPMIFLSGAVSFTLEILWTRLLTLLLGGSVYAFATMLASFLAGIALGASWGARIASDARRAAWGFASAQLAAAVLTLAAFLSVDRLPGLARAVVESSGAGNTAISWLLCGLTLLPGAIAFGATFPCAVRILTRHPAMAASASGRVFAWNTAGAIVGSLAAGYVVLPRLGFADTMVTATSVCLLLALFACLGTGTRRHRLAFVLVTGLGIATLVAIPSPNRRLCFATMCSQPETIPGRSPSSTACRRPFRSQAPSFSRGSGVAPRSCSSSSPSIGAWCPTGCPSRPFSHPGRGRARVWWHAGCLCYPSPPTPTPGPCSSSASERVLP
ncbi:MAG: fused MFS/spermidine synthase [Thermoanaerobaculia bacterium]|nr:fused MFS/spermidine synthase [Thermoanaerobaculia bacterium]